MGTLNKQISQIRIGYRASGAGVDATTDTFNVQNFNYRPKLENPLGNPATIKLMAGNHKKYEQKVRLMFEFNFDGSLNYTEIASVAENLVTYHKDDNEIRLYYDYSGQSTKEVLVVLENDSYEYLLEYTQQTGLLKPKLRFKSDNLFDTIDTGLIF